MNRARILYVGPRSGTCLDRARALERLGHRITHVDLREWLPPTVWVDRVIWRLGGHWFSPWLVRQVHARLHGQRYDLAYVDNGELVSAAVVSALRECAGRVINYNIDDPTGERDLRRFHAYRQALPRYDLVAVVREENVQECKALGAREVVRVWRSADEVNHAPRVMSEDQRRQWSSEVLFLGTWMPERGGFLAELVRRGVPLSIRGSHWQKAPEWPLLKACWKGGAISGDDYAMAIQGARINLGLVSKGNRDLHTTRSLEIPALGALLCAERTSEHLAMYVEGEEAVFWADAAECAERCISLLQDEPRRLRIAHAGRLRYLRNRHGNQDVMGDLVNKVLAA